MTSAQHEELLTIYDAIGDAVSTGAMDFVVEEVGSDVVNSFVAALEEVLAAHREV
jgi:hypothetical protein